MRTAGFLRWRLARSLRTAYAVGLLTHDTFTHRIDDLYGGACRIDPQHLIGDLTFRTRARTRPYSRDLIESILRRHRHRPGADQLPLLALDWTGATPEMLIGRSSRCDLVLDDLNVSRRHAQLFFREGRWILVDLDSTNGTYINGQRVQRSELLPGDVVVLGGEQLEVD